MSRFSQEMFCRLFPPNIANIFSSFFVTFLSNEILEKKILLSRLCRSMQIPCKYQSIDYDTDYSDKTAHI